MCGVVMLGGHSISWPYVRFFDIPIMTIHWVGTTGQTTLFLQESEAQLCLYTIFISFSRWLRLRSAAPPHHVGAQRRRIM